MSHEPVSLPTPTARPGLRLLCVLVKDPLDSAKTIFRPVHTLQPMPPRAMVKGQWGSLRYTGLYLRAAHTTAPASSVLARCLRHRQTYAVCSGSRTFRADGVIA